MKISLPFFWEIISICCCAQNNIHDSTNYYFKTQEEGIFIIKNPFVDKKPAFIINNEIVYNPFYDSIQNQFYVYGRSKSTYQLTQRVNKKHVVFDHVIDINNKNIYKYSLFGPTENWLHAVIDAEKTYEETIYLGNPVKKLLKDSIVLRLYNFFDSKLSFEISLNDESQSISVSGKGEHFVNLYYPVTDGSIHVHIYSFSSFGLIGYRYNELNRNINLHNTFQKLFVDSSFKMSNKNEFFSYYSFMNNSLKEIGTRSKEQIITNLLIQKTGLIKTLKLTKADNVDFAEVDYLILTSDKLINESKNLLTILHTQSPELNFKLLDVQKIYNTLSMSTASAQAIKEYLHLTHPKYVLLVGDANEKENSSNSIIPTFYFNQLKSNARIVSDYTFAYQTDFEKPEFAIGRIPVSNEEELRVYITKLALYLSKQRNEKVLILDDENELRNFVLKPKFSIYKEHQHNFIHNLFYNDFIDEVNFQKPSLLIHIGHGSFSAWKKKQTLHIEEFTKIKKERMFNVIDLSCWTGEFANVESDGFSEKLIKMKEKGAINIFSFSGFSALNNYPSVLDYLLKHMNETDNGTLLNNMKIELLKRNELTVEDARSFNLLGVPNLTINNNVNGKKIKHKK
ncbi:MAG TPA: C25 family cysteine peptidase [Bacteroidia bacterium]|nr:C25 family cysteine peptidase [Bacteroidia bacterium]